MSVVEDLRQVLQDFVAPKLRELEAKIAALDSSVKMGFAGADQLANARHELTVAKLDAYRSEIPTKVERLTRDLDIDRRLEAIERRRRIKRHRSEARIGRRLRGVRSRRDDRLRTSESC